MCSSCYFIIHLSNNSVRKTQLHIGQLACDLLVLHAASGCDTTSYVYGIGKATAVKLFCSVPEMSCIAKIFMDANASRDQVISAGNRLLLQFYHTDTDISLDKLRYIRFARKAAPSVSSIEPKTLPPTSAVATHHSDRIYHQLQA